VPLIERERVEALAPDQAGLAAGLKLRRAGAWPSLGRQPERGLIWGECQGSGAQPYRLAVLLDELASSCSCPSRKIPCKHVLGALLLAAEAPERFPAAEPPPWVDEWVGRRRKSSGRPRPRAEDAAPASLAEAERAVAADAAAEPAAEDPAAAARAAAQRERLRQEREAAIAAGLDQLDAWLLDQLEGGLASFAESPAARCATLARRLVDAKAGGLALAVEQLAADLARTPSAGRSLLALERLGGLALLAAAYRRQDRLPPELREDVRRTVGWSQRREELLEGAGLRVEGDWLVVGRRDELQPDQLLRLETWLASIRPEPGAPAFAVLVDFMPASTRPGAAAMRIGERFPATLVFYPSAMPQRAIVAERGPASLAGNADWPGGSIAGLRRGWPEVLARQPFLELLPGAVTDARLVPVEGNGMALADETGVIPLAGARPALVPLLGLTLLTAVVLLDGHAAMLLAAATPIGLWTPP
jgi:hypothetical protein